MSRGAGRSLRSGRTLRKRMRKTLTAAAAPTAQLEATGVQKTPRYPTSPNQSHSVYQLASVGVATSRPSRTTRSAPRIVAVPRAFTGLPPAAVRALGGPLAAGPRRGRQATPVRVVMVQYHHGGCHGHVRPSHRGAQDLLRPGDPGEH